jgi:hypothetical protein
MLSPRSTGKKKTSGSRMPRTPGASFADPPLSAKAENSPRTPRNIYFNLPQPLIFRKATQSCPIATDNGLPAASKYD